MLLDEEVLPLTRQRLRESGQARGFVQAKGAPGVP